MTQQNRPSSPPEGSPPPVLQVEDLVVGYRRSPVAAPVSLSAGPGDIVAVLGPNGSGKTTLMSTLAGLIPPVSGRVIVQGQTMDIKTPAWRKRIARVADGNDLFPTLNAAEHVELVRRIAGLSTLEAGLRRARIFAMVDMDEATAQIPAADLSLGYRKRLALALSILLPADFWLLDEPTTGLDSGSVTRLEDLLAMLKYAGKIILVSTHGTEWIGRLADRTLTMRGIASPEAGPPFSPVASGTESCAAETFKPGVPPWLESSTW